MEPHSNALAGLFVEPPSEACQARGLEAPGLDQDSERTSSLLTPGKAVSRRSQSRAPAAHSRQGIVAGIEEVQSLAPLSLRSSPNNAALAIRPGDDVADDMTVVAPRPSSIPEVCEEREERTTPDGFEPYASGTRSTPCPPADSGVNPRRIVGAAVSANGPVGNSADKAADVAAAPNHVGHAHKSSAPSAQRAAPHPERWARASTLHSRVGVQWAIALAVAVGAAWYVLTQPAVYGNERHWVSGRSR